MKRAREQKEKPRRERKANGRKRMSGRETERGERETAIGHPNERFLMGKEGRGGGGRGFDNCSDTERNSKRTGTRTKRRRKFSRLSEDESRGRSD